MVALTLANLPPGGGGSGSRDSHSAPLLGRGKGGRGRRAMRVLGAGGGAKDEYSASQAAHSGTSQGEVTHIFRFHHNLRKRTKQYWEGEGRKRKVAGMHHKTKTSIRTGNTDACHGGPSCLSFAASSEANRRKPCWIGLCQILPGTSKKKTGGHSLRAGDGREVVDAGAAARPSTPPSILAISTQFASLDRACQALSGLGALPTGRML